MKSVVQEVYHRLLTAFGPQKWWPGDTQFEILVGAVLVQNTNWQNVERAIHNLREADLLDPQALYEVPAEELEELIRPAGYYRVKAKRLRALLQFVVERYGGSLDEMFRRPLDELRAELLGVHGVGRRRPIRSCSMPAGCRPSSSTPTPIASSAATVGST